MIDEGQPLPASAMGKAFGVFRCRPFLLFWIGTFISNIGNWNENAAQSWAVTSQTAGKPHQAFLVEVLQFADFCPVLLLALLAGAMLGHAALGAAVLGWSVLNRSIEALAIGWGITRDRECLRRPWLYAVRDVLGFAIWTASYVSRKISWRDGRFELIGDGRVRMRDRDGNVVRIENV